MATKNSIEQGKLTSASIEHKLTKFIINPPVNLLKLSIWTFLICLVLSFVAGFINQILLAVIFSIIAGVSIFVAITQTKFFWRMNRYLEAETRLHARANKWMAVVLIIIGVTALAVSFLIS
jgi:hypothetical protein